MSISDDINLIMNKTEAPPTMPPNLREARDMLHWASLFFLIMAALLGLYALFEIVEGLIWIKYGGFAFFLWGAVYFALAFLAFYAGVQVKKTVIPAMDMGDIHKAKEESIKWLIVGLFTGLIPFILMLLAYLKLDESPQPQPQPYQQYPNQQYQAPPPGYQQPAQPYPAPPQQYPPQGQQYQQPQQAPAQQPYQQYPNQQYQAPPAGYQQQPAQPYPAPPQQVPPQEATPQPAPAPEPEQPPTQEYVPPQPQSPPEQESSAIPMQVIRCPQCGAEVPPGSDTCPSCGAKL